MIRARNDGRASAALHGVPPTAEVLSLFRASRVPSRGSRAYQRILMKRGRLTFAQDWLRPLQRARCEALGPGANGPPRFLVRVDEFPYSSGYDDPRFGYEASARFHDVMAEAGVPHLMALVSQWTHAPLEPDASGGRRLDDRDRELLARMRADGVAFAQHGYTHRTRHASPRRHSELSGLDDAALIALLDRGQRELAEAGAGRPSILVPPFNRFDARQWPVLAERFEVITGGPESVMHLGFHGGPQFHDGAVYLPCYAPLYDAARAVLPAAEAIIEASIGTWVPIVLHTSWEVADDFGALRRLAERIAPFAASWDDFLDAVRASHAAAANPTPE